MIDPGYVFKRCQTERRGGKQRRNWRLAGPEQRCRVAEFSRPGTNCIEYLQRRHQFPSRFQLDLQPSVRRRGNLISDALGRHAGPGQVTRP